MNIVKIEGSLWHSLPEDSGEENPQPDKMRFAHLLMQAASGTANVGGKPAAGREPARYRLVGGPAAGLVCEIHESEGEIHLKVFVPEYRLFIALNPFSAWLNASLLEAGHRVILEVVYAKHGTG